MNTLIVPPIEVEDVSKEPAGLSWGSVLSYQVQTATGMHPHASYVVRVLIYRQVSLTTRILGPFHGDIGKATASMIANALTAHIPRDGEGIWTQLYPAERTYIHAGHKLPIRPALDDDEIPF